MAGKVTILNHPLINHKMTILRNEETYTKLFKELIDEIASILAVEVTRDLPMETVNVKTPLMETTGEMIAGKKLVVVPILRAGLGMVDGFLRILPNVKVGHIGLYRDPKTLKPIEYLCKLPVDSENRDMVIIDPMLATGGSAEAAVQFIKERYNPNSIKFVCILGCPEGLKMLTDNHPDIDVYVAYMDEKLNEHGYILPGLGDAGDRMFGTNIKG